MNPSVAWAAGEMISTTSDLNRFFAALLGGRLLRAPQLAEMQRTVPVEPGFEYGLGLARTTYYCGTVTWGHGGGIPGYVTISEHADRGRTQLVASINPLRNDQAVFEAAIRFIDTALCGAPAPATKAGVRAGTSARPWTDAPAVTRILRR
jgi:D-alanyl-D-alanine carboxypeptidase